MYHTDFFYLGVIVFCLFITVLIVVIYEARLKGYLEQIKHYQLAVKHLQEHITALENLVDVLDKKE